MSASIKILFCDNLAEKHTTFLERVAAGLKSHFPEDTFRFEHSQSWVRRFEKDYSTVCQELGAQSVDSWLAQGILFDLVITDMDFELGTHMGDKETGLNIVETIYEQTAQQTPWMQFIIMTMHAERVDDPRWIDLTRKTGFDSKNLLVFSQTVTTQDWDRVLNRAQDLLLEIAKKRSKHYEESLARGVAPILYEVIIVHTRSATDPIGVMVKEQAPQGRKLTLVLTAAQRYTFEALAQAAPLFRTGGELRIQAHQIKMTTGDRKDQVTTTATTPDTSRRHVREIRAEVSRKDVPPPAMKSWEAERASQNHWGPHEGERLCGNCLLYQRKGQQGYALTASVSRRQVAEEEDIHKALAAYLASS